ncbi:hypothetical protein B1812_07650 [Methylocystis bryophila]|uniref:Uncharacterized protein n=1 Tax=Methylocystis bryophila TaxID=655015 RepID=A0A1W6MTR9_9HYPH|nr:hypothetical protein B1812_07650 [Methylocystis bryophila]
MTAHVGACRLRAPPPGENRDEVAHWAQTFHEDFCAEWRASDGTPPSMTLCKHCAYWSFRKGGLTPVDRRDQLAKWWEQAGHCQRHAPLPSDIPGHSAHWRATNREDGCFEGKPRAAQAQPPGPQK